MTTLQIRIDEKTKARAKKILEKTGLDMSSAVKLFLQQTIIMKGLPFRPLTSNGMTFAEEKELRKRLASPESEYISQEEMESFVDSL